MPDFQGVKLYIAASISYWHKSPLFFYNDENDAPQIKLLKPPKPRKTIYDTKEQFDEKIVLWKASLPHNVDVKPKGNSIIQKYYTEKLLPEYINIISKQRINED